MGTDTAAAGSSINVSGTTHTAAGTYNGDAWSFTGGTNYNDASGAVNDAIAKASSTTVVTCPTNVTFTGAPLMPCTAAATGVGGLSTSVAVTYGNNTNAGTATADATYAGDANHISSTATQKTFTIDKATSTTTLTCPASVIYNGTAQTPCSASYSGAGGLSGSLTPTYTNNVYPGTATAVASYTGDLNHTGSTSSPATFTIGYGVCGAGYGPGGVILQPINSDGTSVYQRKGGSTYSSEVYAVRCCRNADCEPHGGVCRRNQRSADHPERRAWNR